MATPEQVKKHWTDIKTRTSAGSNTAKLVGEAGEAIVDYIANSTTIYEPVFTTNAATTRKTVPQENRKRGLFLSYYNGSRFVLEQYAGTAFDDATFANETLWIQFENVKESEEKLFVFNATYAKPLPAGEYYQNPWHIFNYANFPTYKNKNGLIVTFEKSANYLKTWQLVDWSNRASAKGWTILSPKQHNGLIVDYNENSIIMFNSIPVYLRKKGAIISYIDANGIIVTMQFIDTNLSNWINSNFWRVLPSANGNVNYINLSLSKNKYNYTSKQEARNDVPLHFRKTGLTIHYCMGTNYDNWVTECFNHPSLTQWETEQWWEKLLDAKDLKGITTQITDINTSVNTINNKLATLNTGSSISSTKIHKTLKALNNYKNGFNFSKPVKIILLGDSITVGSWAANFKTWITALYSLPNEAVEIKSYGGYSHVNYLPFIDSVINENPDLIIFNENYETYDRILLLESFIKLFKEHTTSDIGIATWSLDANSLKAYLADQNTTTPQIAGVNQHRELARIYDVHLFDTQKAVLNKALQMQATGTSIDDIILYLYGAGNTTVHLGENGYNLMLEEMKTHFVRWESNWNVPCSNYREQMIFPVDALRYTYFKPKGITVTGDVVISPEAYLNGYSLSCLQLNNTGEVVIDLINSIGFEINTYPHATAGGKAEIYIRKKGETTWLKPSEIRNNLLPLQYATEIRSITYTGNSEMWRSKRPFMYAIVTNNYLTDKQNISGQFKIVVTSVELVDNKQVVKCVVKNPQGAIISNEFTVGKDEVVIPEYNLKFPLKHNGADNFYITDANIDQWGQPAWQNYTVGDEYGFYIKNNCTNTILRSEEYNRVFGYERADYEVKIKTIQSTINVRSINNLKA